MTWQRLLGLGFTATSKVVKTYTTAESEGRLAIRRPGCRSARERFACGTPPDRSDAAADKPMMSVGEEREILSPEITQIGR